MLSDAEPLTTESLVDEALELAEGLDRPLRYVQLNSFYNGSTGSIMKKLHVDLSHHGVDSYIFWGRRHETINDHERCVASKLGYLSHGVLTRLTGRMGFYSKNDTKRLIKLLDDIDPDVVHLHNIHGYWINIELLFGWLANHHCKVRWTLHDCWPITGHCAYFSAVGCFQWMSQCASITPCPQLDTYPKTFAKHSCSRNYMDKKRVFSMVPSDRMTLISPSAWLAGLINHSFLKSYSVEVRYNTVDKSIFKPVCSSFRSSYNIGNRFMILGVASPWTERKGLSDFIRLVNDLDSRRFAVVLVGLSKRQLLILPNGIIGLERTDSPQELAEIYSSADVFFNPTVEENYPSVNLEAEACGTPVLTYNTGGCSETISLPESKCVKSYVSALEELQEMAIRHPPVQGINGNKSGACS